ncbi:MULTISPECIES: hypothetical protein [Flavobacteriaceae]|uniref:hypothetical protein n=1 Tax=Flavobacteriaceae TaxID=49546 RepID=UPI0014918713|nr:MULTISPECIES: hypothetical protein [Allomuricauda]MDC6365929.1 hypothetical protein [Muricauda sp. AC10]
MIFRISFIFFFLGICFVFGQNGNEITMFRFEKGPNGGFVFKTDKLEGVLRLKERSTGLNPIYVSSDTISITKGEGLFNHYRVFSHGKRYGYGARRWSSTTKLLPNGSVEVFWAAQEKRPFELRATYQLVSQNTIDVTTVVRAFTELQDFEAFLASYFSADFIESEVLVADKAGNLKFIEAKRSLGEWLAFPRDDEATSIIGDGRWELEPHPLKWEIMPKFYWPVAIRRNPKNGLTVLCMTDMESCFGVFTPYGKEKHFSNYMSLFGNDLTSGDMLSAHSRLVVLKNPSKDEIIEHIRNFMSSQN